MAGVPTRTLERIAMHPEQHIPQHVHVPPQLARRAVVDALTSRLLKPAVVKSQLPSLVRILSRLSTMPEFTQHMQIWLTAAAAAVEVAPHAVSIPSGPHSLIRLLHVYAKCWPNRHATCILASALLPLLTPGLSRLGAPELPMLVDAMARILSSQAADSASSEWTELRSAAEVALSHTEPGVIAILCRQECDAGTAASIAGAWRALPESLNVNRSSVGLAACEALHRACGSELQSHQVRGALASIALAGAPLSDAAEHLLVCSAAAAACAPHGALATIWLQLASMASAEQQPRLQAAAAHVLASGASAWGASGKAPALCGGVEACAALAQAWPIDAMPWREVPALMRASKLQLQRPWKSGGGTAAQKLRLLAAALMLQSGLQLSDAHDKARPILTPALAARVVQHNLRHVQPGSPYAVPAVAALAHPSADQLQSALDHAEAACKQTRSHAHAGTLAHDLLGLVGRHGILPASLRATATSTLGALFQAPGLQAGGASARCSLAAAAAAGAQFRLVPEAASALAAAAEGQVGQAVAPDLPAPARAAWLLDASMALLYMWGAAHHKSLLPGFSSSLSGASHAQLWVLSDRAAADLRSATERVCGMLSKVPAPIPGHVQRATTALQACVHASSALYDAAIAAQLRPGVQPWWAAVPGVQAVESQIFPSSDLAARQCWHTSVAVWPKQRVALICPEPVPGWMSASDTDDWAAAQDVLASVAACSGNSSAWPAPTPGMVSSCVAGPAALFAARLLRAAGFDVRVLVPERLVTLLSATTAPASHTPLH